MIGFISCNMDNNTVRISKTEYQKLIGDTITPEYPKYFEVGTERYVIELGSDKHEYYSFDTYARGLHYFHYPDCKLCKQRYDSLLKHG
jgi:hypothetical protein